LRSVGDDDFRLGAQGQPVQICSEPLSVGDQAPSFSSEGPVGLGCRAPSLLALSRPGAFKPEGASGTLRVIGGRFGNTPYRGTSSCCDLSRFQRLGPNAGGGAERGLGACRSCEVVVVRLVAVAAPRLAGSWFGVCGSRSRMRHQSAAAGWSSGRGPAAAANRTRSVASKPARVRLLSLSSSSGRNGSAVALGASVASI
jgi:hypothetical protein